MNQNEKMNGKYFGEIKPVSKTHATEKNETKNENFFHFFFLPFINFWKVFRKKI